MATASKQQTRITNLYFVLCCVIVLSEQNDPSGRHYNGDSVHVAPNSGDRDFKTFTYNNRRYGVYQPNYYYGRGGEPYDPARAAGSPNNRYDPNSRYDPVSIIFILLIKTFYPNHHGECCLMLLNNTC